MSVLPRWMDYTLRFGGTFNIFAGLGMISLYHEGFKILGVEKPSFLLPVQLVGWLVILFGIGYWLTALSPVENRNVLLLGFLSKAGGSLLGIGYTIAGTLPWWFLIVLFLADMIYLPPFALILRRLYALARQRTTPA